MPTSKTPDTTPIPNNKSPPQNETPSPRRWRHIHIPTLLKAIIPNMSTHTQNQPQSHTHQNPQHHPYPRPHPHPHPYTQPHPPTPPSRDSWPFVTSNYHNTILPSGNLPQDPYSPPTSSSSDSSTDAARKLKAKEDDTNKKLEYVDRMLTAELLKEGAMATAGMERRFWDSRREEIRIRAAGGNMWSGRGNENWRRMEAMGRQARGGMGESSRGGRGESSRGGRGFESSRGGRGESSRGGRGFG